MYGPDAHTAIGTGTVSNLTNVVLFYSRKYFANRHTLSSMWSGVFFVRSFFFCGCVVHVP